MTDLLVAGTTHGVVMARRDSNGYQVEGRSLETYGINSVSIQAGAVLVGSRQGVFRSDDLGQTWRPASDGLADLHVRWMAHQPGDSSRVLAGTEPASLYLSRDGGTSWAARPEVSQLRDEHGWYLPYSPESGCLRGFGFHGDRVYAAAEVGGLLRSDDGGETWALAEGSSGDPRALPKGHIHPDVHSVAVHPASPDLVLAPTGGGFYRSEDGGASWESRYHCYCRAVWVDPQDAGHLVLGPADSVDRNGRIEQTFDGGATWELASEGLEVPWARHMVERFVQGDQELFAVLSNGELLATPLETLIWKRVLPDVEGVRALAVASRS